MHSNHSPTLRVRVKGELACFSRPELSVERVSYPVMTPSAARGVLEAVCWKPAIRWEIERIHVLSEICFTSFRRNEVNKKASAPAAAIVKNGGEIDHYFADEDRAQRNTVALRDVDYVIEARFHMTDRAGPSDNVFKFLDIFSRRVEKGQCFHRPYLGTRECVAEVYPADGEIPEAIDDTRDLGLMLWDINYGEGKKPRNTALFFNAKLEQGILDVPGLDEMGGGT